MTNFILISTNGHLWFYSFAALMTIPLVIMPSLAMVYQHGSSVSGVLWFVFAARVGLTSPTSLSTIRSAVSNSVRGPITVSRWT